jgi:protein-disulfide isomerase
MLTPEDTSKLTYMSHLILPVSPRDHVEGPLDASEVLVEYGDYECPYCEAVLPTLKEIQSRMGDSLAFVYRHFPLPNIHTHAWKAAEAAEAAAAQGRFWEMHERLFQRQPALDERDLVVYARDLGLDPSRFTLDLTAGMHSAHVDEDFRSGVLSGVNGTPTFFINGIRHEGSYDVESLLSALHGLRPRGPTSGRA